jgi:hypothetical protein
MLPFLDNAVCRPARFVPGTPIEPFLHQLKDDEMSQNRRNSRPALNAVLRAELLEGRLLLSNVPQLPPVSTPVNFQDGFYTVIASAGSAIITLGNNEFPGPDGLPTASPEQVYLSYGGGTAVPGVDYTPGGQTVNFAAGQGSETVQVPILPGSPSEGTRLLQLDLSTSPGGQPNSRAFLLITHNSDTTPPTVTGTKALTRGPYVTGFVITFSKDMAPGPVQDVKNYAVEDPRSIRAVKAAQLATATRLISLKSAVYDSATHSVTLTPAHDIRKFPAFLITYPPVFNMMNLVATLARKKALPSPSQLLPELSPITDSAGNPLDSTGSGAADGVLMTTVGVGKAGRKLVATMP